jgi:hypothetical protein
LARSGRFSSTCASQAKIAALDHLEMGKAIRLVLRLGAILGEHKALSSESKELGELGGFVFSRPVVPHLVDDYAKEGSDHHGMGPISFG